MQQYLFNQTLIKDTTDSFVKKSTKYLEFLNNFSNNMIDHCGGIRAPYGELGFPYNSDCIINYFDDNNLKEFNQKYQNYIYACRKVKVPITGMAMDILQEK